MSHTLDTAQRPRWPKRAIVTAGMPYGNKHLHFGHVGGVFIPADFFARFLRDRLGSKNVLFVSGTDCYGSPIMESYRKLEGTPECPKSLTDYVQANHNDQAQTLEGYEISCDLFGGSALAPAAETHNHMTDEIVRRLAEKGALERRATKQFYDPKAGQFLNGRQVLGHCPIQGCKSEKAYADECDLGHQFEPEELIAPISALTGETPELRPVDNLYFDLPAFTDYLKEFTSKLENDETVRPVVVKTLEEWLGEPNLYIQNKFREAFDVIESELPQHTVTEPEGNKTSFTVTFPSWRERDAAHEVLKRGGVRFRSGKALVPFRITGNISWGVPVPDLLGCQNLTCWVWPESLWAPISFTRTVLTQDQTAAAERYASDDWRDWWCSPEAHAYQFIGQDNIYFYGIAQSALWKALDWNLEQSTLVANYHVLYLGKKASSSSQTPPPPASELLKHYDAEGLRAHFLSLGLGDKPVSFSPKAYDTRVTGKNPDGTDLLARDDKRVIDPVMKESALLTGVFNRLARSCFYGVAQKEGDPSVVRTGCIPAGDTANEVRTAADKVIVAYEQAVHRFEFHRALSLCDEYLRAANKRWSDASKAAKNLMKEDQVAGDAAMHQALVDAFLELRVATVLMHPVVPAGCETICEYFAIDPSIFFSWDHIADTTDELVEALGETAGTHVVKPLPPRFDFFSFA